MPGSRSSRAAIVAGAAVLFAACLLTASRVPLFDPDEGYYPATALESVTSGAGWDPQLDGAPRWDKPILSYALIEAAFWLFGPSTAASRLPSALEAALLVLIVGLLVMRTCGTRAGMLSALVVASSLGVQVFARAAHPEIAVVLSICTTELLFCLWWLRDASRWRVAVIAGAVAGYGILAKGPVAVVLPALMIAASVPLLPPPRPSWRVAVQAMGVAAAIAAIVAVPWYAAMIVRHGWPFVAEALWHHNVVRYATAELGHRGSVFFFVLPTLVGLLPWTGFLVQSCRAAFRDPSRARQVVRTVMLTSAATAFLFYSASGSKLANYALVLIPPLGILIALHLDELSDSRGVRTLDELVAGLSVVAVRGAGAVALLWGVVGVPAAVLLVSGVVAASARRRDIRVAALGLGGIVAPLALLFSANSLLDSTYPWREFGERMRADRAYLWVYSYRAPSLSFYAQRPVHHLGQPSDVDAVLASRNDGWLVIDRSTWDQLPHHSTRTVIVDEKGRMLLVHVAQQ